MNPKRLKIPAIIFAIGLILSLLVCLGANIILTPEITEGNFRYTVTYKLNGEIKTLEGVYTCRYDGYRPGGDPRDRYYTGEYTVDGQATCSHSYTIAEKDGAELYIVTVFDDCYLMGDTKDMDYEPFLEEPYLEAVDKEGYAYDETEMPIEFTAEIISWEYPEPIENTFVFGGFSILHAGSMMAMLAVGVLVMLACVIFVKKDQTVTYKVLDEISIVVNCILCFAAIPFITIVTALLQLTIDSDSLMYQMFLCIPALTAFTVAASLVLRRKGFTKSGFCVQLVGPVLFFVPAILEAVIINLFG